MEDGFIRVQSARTATDLKGPKMHGRFLPLVFFSSSVIAFVKEKWIYVKLCYVCSPFKLHRSQMSEVRKRLFFSALLLISCHWLLEIWRME
jgi:hypothetical protein